jgi:hypothetical protein
MAVEKTLRLESRERFPLFHRHDDGLITFHQGLLRREEDETTVQRRAGKPERSNASLGTEGFNRTGTCESSSSARRNRLSTKRPDTFTRTELRQLQTSCSSVADHTFEKRNA